MTTDRNINKLSCPRRTFAAHPSVCGVICGLIALCVVVLPGCVERTLTINTAPDGALVYLNDEEAGRAPVSKNFLWYGNYDIVIRKEGYKTLKTSANVRAPWYQIPPIDFFSECLVPLTLRDNHYLEFELEPIEPPGPDELVKRAEQFKERTVYGEK